MKKKPGTFDEAVDMLHLGIENCSTYIHPGMNNTGPRKEIANLRAAIAVLKACENDCAGGRAISEAILKARKIAERNQKEKS